MTAKRLVLFLALPLGALAQGSIGSIHQTGVCPVAGVVGNVTMHCGVDSEVFRGMQKQFEAQLKQRDRQIDQLSIQIAYWKGQYFEATDKYFELSSRLADAGVNEDVLGQIQGLQHNFEHFFAELPKTEKGLNESLAKLETQVDHIERELTSRAVYAETGISISSVSNHPGTPVFYQVPDVPNPVLGGNIKDYRSDLPWSPAGMNASGFASLDALNPGSGGFKDYSAPFLGGSAPGMNAAVQFNWERASGLTSSDGPKTILSDIGDYSSSLPYGSSIGVSPVLQFASGLERITGIQSVPELNPVPGVIGDHGSPLLYGSAIGTNSGLERNSGLQSLAGFNPVPG